MDNSHLWETLARQEGGKIIYLILDGLGGIQESQIGKTELEQANTPNLDQLAERSVCGLLEIVAPGITPGSGPGHLSLFGYNPQICEVGRGIFSALGIDFALKKGDIAARINFATIDDEGKIQDRRAGRIKTSVNQKLCEKIRRELHFEGVECFLETVSEHRAVLILRGEGLYGNIGDTDPQKTGLKPLEPVARDSRSSKTCEIVKTFLCRTMKALKAEHPANMLLARGFDTYRPVPGFRERFHLNGLCIANYPMYRGVSKFVGMDALPPSQNLHEQISSLSRNFTEYDFFFVHVKQTDKAGEDKNFRNKICAIEEVDQALPKILELKPDVLVITGDHSTPAAMGEHSWHPVPILLCANTARIDKVAAFDEISCIQGGLGRQHSLDLMGLALAHAGRLKKYGA